MLYRHSVPDVDLSRLPRRPLGSSMRRSFRIARSRKPVRTTMEEFMDKKTTALSTPFENHTTLRNGGWSMGPRSTCRGFQVTECRLLRKYQALARVSER